MARLWLKATLLSEVAVTENSATVGGHRSLGYLPGSAFYGAFAATEYPKDAGAAFRRFHSGQLRFGPGLPMGGDGGPSIPMPLSFHHEKGKDAFPDGGLADGSVINLARGVREEGIQYQQLREGFVDATGAHIRPRFRSSMRTAVDPNGQAREGFLFTISSLPAGTVYLAPVEADSKEDVTFVRDTFKDKEIRVGRSKGAEFGRVRVQVLDPAPAVGAWSTVTNLPSSKAVFLCVSDIALRDPETGQPTLQPAAEAFGLADTWKWSGGQSFLRFRSYSPFNTYRRRPDLERQVIQAGSVIVFETQTGSLCGAGNPIHSVGEYRAEGLGWVLFEPCLLADVNPSGRPKDRVAATPTAEAVDPATLLSSDPLWRWLKQCDRDRKNRDQAWQTAMTWAQEFVKWRISNAQWGEVRQIARLHRASGEKLAGGLGAHLGNGIRRNEKCWGKKVGAATAAEKIVKMVESVDSALAPVALEIASVHAVRLGRKAVA